MLRESIRLAGAALRAAGHPLPPGDELERRVAAEHHDTRNHRVRPLQQRLARVFALRGAADGPVMAATCRAFMGPVFASARRYDDTLDALSSWRRRGLLTGSPARPVIHSLAELEPILHRWDGAPGPLDGA